MERHRALHREAGEVHELHRLQQHGLLAAALGRDQTAGRLAALAALPRRKAVLGRELVDDAEPDVVTVPLVLRAGIAQPDDQPHRAPLLLLGSRRAEPALRRAFAPAAGAAALASFAPAAGAAAAPPPEPRQPPEPRPQPPPRPRPRPESRQPLPRASAQVTTARSRPVTDATPAGSVMSETWKTSPISSGETSSVELDRDVARLRAHVESRGGRCGSRRRRSRPSACR